MSEYEGLAAWLRLTLIPGIGGETQRKLLAAFGLPEAIFAAGRLTVRSVIGDRADLLFDSEVSENVERSIAWADQPGQHILTLADADYPQALLEIPDPPSLLYVRGKPALLQKSGLAMVGSRNATPQGLQTAENFAKTLAAKGYCIISGLALGIDAAAHRGALAADGETIAVIGTGADRLYPARNRDLALAIAERGAIVSEFPLGTPALAANFPRRNRIISGLSRGVLVVEAAPESGSLITARLAAEQGREVFAIPGSIHSPVSRGCHKLIRQGAKLVETAQDILEELGNFAEPTDLAEPASVPDDNLVLSALGHDPCGLDDLQERTRLATDALLTELLTLELAGQIATLPGNRYQRLV
ncbi:DNA-processing protein DprA [Dechloromonas denitrificans]|uniref:DNA-processing protein DprA n=1 Tax=Azonexaceae TaxID=2008795 RepID=UPI001CF83234|nr:DNA-processing protein DprA [Dechloromonas denitrificans]UCV03720.1 DNA-processing protein DprA [Dechloromonas denitrificans]UCV07981.1 DNA-processing protein DprA [Dechloromonas denitrificans]